MQDHRNLAVATPGDPAARRLGAVALACTAAFALAAFALQFARGDLDWIRAPLSFYLVGPWGAALQAAYCALGVGLAALAAGLYRNSQAHARSGAPVLLFVAAGVALMVTALAHTNLPSRSPTLQGWLHGVAAQTAFLCVTTAMLLQAAWFRRDRFWRTHARGALSLAAVAFVAVWVLALWRAAPRGLAQKCVIAIIVAWLALAAWRLWRRPAE
jgi:hypothetical protein